EDGIRDFHVTGVQTCALPISRSPAWPRRCARRGATGGCPRRCSPVDWRAWPAPEAAACSWSTCPAPPAGCATAWRCSPRSSSTPSTRSGAVTTAVRDGGIFRVRLPGQDVKEHDGSWWEARGTVRRMRGWPVSLAEGEVGLRPLRLRDAAALRETRARNAEWLRPWEPTHPELPAQSEGLLPYLATVQAVRREARHGIAMPWAVTWE